ncbi:MAG: hypothetical protein JF924_17630 [Candidatus Dormibacteraeota bacterium]|nr:hypothetical protein [Candidatus Dormibacteraeota bacterium]
MSGSGVVTHPASHRLNSGLGGPSRPGRGLSLAGLAMRQLRLKSGWTATLVLGLGMAFAVAVAAPLAGVMAADASLRAAVGGPGSDVPLTVAQQKVPDQSGFESAQARLASRVEGRLGRYLAGSSALATLGPLTPASLNEIPAPARVDSSRLAVGYLRDLADQVELVAGAVPPDGLGGSADVAATMAQTEADALGLHLGDRLCLDFATGGSRWCARVAGLWRPLQGGDPFRLETARQVELVVGRYDFYRLMKLAAAPVATVGRQFHVDVNSLDYRNAGDLVSGVRDLRRYFTSQGDLFDTSLDGVVEGFEARQRGVRIASQMLGAALAALVLCVTAFLAGHFLRLQDRELRLVRARGWPRRRTKRLLMLQLSLLVFVPLVLGAGLALGLAAVFGLTVFGVPPPWPRLADGLSTALPVLAALASLTLLWFGLSWRVGLAADGRVARQASSGSSDSRGRRAPAALTVLGAVAALALLAAVRLQEDPAPRWSPAAPAGSGPAVDWLTAGASLVAVLLLSAVAVQGLPLVARLAAGLDQQVSGSLARWQLGRRPWQHSQIAFLLTAAVAVATVGVLAATGGPPPGQPLAEVATLIAGALGALLIALFAFALHFRAVAGERAAEYAALLVSGLPGRALRRSLVIEQRAVLWHGLGFGIAWGVALALALLPSDPLGAVFVAAAARGAAILLAFTGAMVVAGWATRTWLGRIDPGDRLRALP